MVDKTEAKTEDYFVTEWPHDADIEPERFSKTFLLMRNASKDIVEHYEVVLGVAFQLRDVHLVRDYMEEFTLNDLIHWMLFVIKIGLADEILFCPTKTSFSEFMLKVLCGNPVGFITAIIKTCITKRDKFGRIPDSCEEEDIGCGDMEYEEGFTLLNYVLQDPSILLPKGSLIQWYSNFALPAQFWIIVLPSCSIDDVHYFFRQTSKEVVGYIAKKNPKLISNYIQDMRKLLDVFESNADINRV